MKTAVALLFLLVAPSFAFAAPIRGTIRAASGEPLPGVTVWVDGSQLTSITDADGQFEVTAGALPAKVIAHLGGFDPVETVVNGEERLDITLALSAMSDSVTVSARAPRVESSSAFDLRPLDILKAPGAQADLFRALQMMPGVAKVDEGAGLFVRGGDVSEVRVFLDGTSIAHPFRYETPTGGQFGTVTPMLLEGLSFSTGGFSAKYGNALSAVLDLRGLSQPSSDQMLLSAGLAGVSGRASFAGGEDRGLRASGNITTTQLLFELNGAPRQFDQVPEGIDLNLSLHRTTSLGNFKFFAMTQRDRVGVELQDGAFDGFLHSSAEQSIVATSWKRVTGAWQLASSLGADSHDRRTLAGVLDLDSNDRRVSWRFDAARSLGRFVMRTGADADAQNTRIAGTVSIQGGDLGGAGGSKTFDVGYRDAHGGAHVEIERTFGRLTPVLGVRVDRNRLIEGATIDPRASLAVALGGSQTLRVAWGIYHQSPSANYFDREGPTAEAAVATSRLESMQAEHRIIGWELGNVDAPLFARIEAYEKRYTDLPLETTAEAAIATGAFTSEGYGSARGIDLFLQKRWAALELRGSASLVDSLRRWTPADQRRQFALPEGTWRPDFDIPRTFGMSAIVHASKSIDVGTTMTYASGRPHTPVSGSITGPFGFLPSYGPINSERLPAYVRQDINVSYRTSTGPFSIVYFAAVSNALARENFSDYAYNADYSARAPIVSASPRSFYFGFSLFK